VIPVAEKRLTSVKEELGTSISIKEAQNALVQGFQKTFRVQPVEGRLTSYEQKLAEKLRREKFATDCWNFEGKIS